MKKKETGTHARVYRYERGMVTEIEHAPVREFPLKLMVNDRELATLIASPHDLRYLVAGFLLLQGFVRSLEDFHVLSVCEEFGIANVRLKHEPPQELRPVLTSGCGTGITFSIPAAPAVKNAGWLPIFPEDLCHLMEELSRAAFEYRQSGGIHSAAVGGGRRLLLFSEDLGRHNTLDRIAGEALFRGIDLRGKVLVTSGRISMEMVSKAARLEIPVIASRTSPTDLAVHLAEEAGITLVGYLRGTRFNVYSHPQRLGRQAAFFNSVASASVGVPGQI